MAIAVEMPKLGNTVEECLISSWRKHQGDVVATGDVIAEVETDKASFDITAPSDGTLLEIFFDEGALVPVFTTLCVIGAAGEATDGFRPGGAATADAPAAPSPAPVTVAAVPEAATAVDPGATTSAAAPEESGAMSPRARRFAREHDFHPASITGTGPGGRVLEADVRELLRSSARVSAVAQEQISRGQVAKGPGSGIGGLIRSVDVGAPAERTTPAQGTAPAERGAPAERISSVRARIAKRLRESLGTTAQYTLNSSANAGELLSVRRTLKRAETTAGISINDLVVYCTIRALMDSPTLNSEFVDGTLRRHPEINMGFACDTDRGLMVPVVHDSQNLSLLGLSLRMKELAAQAVSGTIGIDDLTGGTFTVSNLGSLGIESFTPVINPPQVAILGVDTIALKPVRKRDGNIEFIDSIGLSLTLDHQVVDGAPGARFLNVLKSKLEIAETLCTI